MRSRKHRVVAMNEDWHGDAGAAADRIGAGPASLRHELAERLQSAGNYLRAARRLLAGGGGEHARVPEAVEKAIEQLGRAEIIFHQLRRDDGARAARVASRSDESR
jgi:hypothetical protein